MTRAQLGDDLLDFMASEESLGKPVCADLSLGIATAPVLLAVQEVCSIVSRSCPVASSLAVIMVHL